MFTILKKFINTYHYSVASIKNRFPCKIIEVKNISDFHKPIHIKFIAATKINIRSLTTQELLSDPLLVEKFHPTDGVKLGFLSCGEILLKDNVSIEEARKLYLTIVDQMFQGIIIK